MMSRRNRYVLWHPVDVTRDAHYPSRALILNPPFLEGKTLDLGTISFLNRQTLCYKMAQQQKKKGHYSAAHIQDGKLSLIFFDDPDLSAYLEKCYNKGIPLPSLYLLDDLFFKALCGAHLIRKKWIFVLREEEDVFALSCYHLKVFLFRRSFSKERSLEEEIKVSLHYLKRYGYQNEDTFDTSFTSDKALKKYDQEFFDTREGHTSIPSMKNLLHEPLNDFVLKDSVLNKDTERSDTTRSNVQLFFFCKGDRTLPSIPTIVGIRLPFDMNQVIEAGLAQRKKIIFSPPKDLSKAIFFTLVRQASLFFLFPIFLVSVTLWYASLSMFSPDKLALLNTDLRKAKILPKGYSLLNYLDQRRAHSFSFELFEKVSLLLKNKKQPFQIDVSNAQSTSENNKAFGQLKLLFDESLHGQSFETFKKKLSPYQVSIAHKTISITHKIKSKNTLKSAPISDEQKRGIHIE